MTEITNDEVELIRLRVAERLGWGAVEYNRNSLLVGLQPGKRRLCAVPSYARDIKAVWEIVELLARAQVRINIANEPLRGYIRNYFVEIGEKDELLGKASHRSAPIAICLAFLEVPRIKMREVTRGLTTLDSGDFIEK